MPNTKTLDKLNQLLPEFALDATQADLFHKIETTNNSYFIQGQAGTGKSTFIRYLQAHSQKKVRIACPTALAALHIGGVTLHSLFQLPLKDFFIPDELELKKKTGTILRKTDILVIDEASMIRPDILDAIDFLCKLARGNALLPFGGIQIILIGDLCQLPPVIKSSTYPIFRAKYGFSEAYFFDAPSFKKGNFATIVLTTVYRQSDSDLLARLIDLRHNRKINETVSFFNEAYIENSTDRETAVTITPYKSTAEQINQARLSALTGETKIYEAETIGTFTKMTETPAPQTLVLKEGALVIFNKNNPPYWINGSTGTILQLDEDFIWVQLLNNRKTVLVKRETWESFIYEYNKETDEVIEKLNGTFTQFPLQLGYALTIHKAQGKTLDKVIIDMDRGAFAHGQLYVALSRTRTYRDIHLKNKLHSNDIIVNSRVLAFLREQLNPSDNRSNNTVPFQS